jgi:hypothetical protein
MSSSYNARLPTPETFGRLARRGGQDAGGGPLDDPSGRLRTAFSNYRPVAGDRGFLGLCLCVFLFLRRE